jgi:5,10-methylene-tetrahydrofolate dehydrogenase/methenyl tetrahydrofolate cyclohydrolase
MVMAKYLKSREIIDSKLETLNSHVESLKKMGKIPKMRVILVGEKSSLSSLCKS